MEEFPYKLGSWMFCGYYSAGAVGVLRAFKPSWNSWECHVTFKGEGPNKHWFDVKSIRLADRIEVLLYG